MKNTTATAICPFCNRSFKTYAAADGSLCLVRHGHQQGYQGNECLGYGLAISSDPRETIEHAIARAVDKIGSRHTSEDERKSLATIVKRLAEKFREAV